MQYIYIYIYYQYSQSKYITTHVSFPATVRTARRNNIALFTMCSFAVHFALDLSDKHVGSDLKRHQSADGSIEVSFIFLLTFYVHFLNNFTRWRLFLQHSTLLKRLLGIYRKNNVENMRQIKLNVYSNECSIFLQQKIYLLKMNRRNIRAYIGSEQLHIIIG